MSGHSKWSTIKRDKEKEDSKRGLLFAKHAREIVVAAKLNADPNANPRLRRAIQAAKDISMPKDKITYAIQRGTGQIPGKTYEEVLYEGYGPEGVAILVECLTDNKKRTVAEIRFVFQKAGGSLGEIGCVSWMFENKNQFTFDKKTLQHNIQYFEEQAIEAGAEDIEETDQYIYILTSFQNDTETILKVFKNLGHQPINYGTVKKVQNQILLSNDKKQKVLRLLASLENLEDVQNVYSNLQHTS